jgi:sulfur-oxidizing protein SoxB
MAHDRHHLPGHATLTEMTGETIKTVMEDVADNLFNPDPYYQQGGDMVRVGGLHLHLRPKAGAGKRINNMMLNGKAIEASKTYKVAGWAPVAEGAKGDPIWDVMEAYFKNHKTISPRKINTPKLVGMEGNPGLVV